MTFCKLASKLEIGHEKYDSIVCRGKEIRELTWRKIKPLSFNGFLKEENLR